MLIGSGIRVCYDEKVMYSFIVSWLVVLVSMQLDLYIEKN